MANARYFKRGVRAHRSNPQKLNRLSVRHDNVRSGTLHAASHQLETAIRATYQCATRNPRDRRGLRLRRNGPSICRNRERRVIFMAIFICRFGNRSMLAGHTLELMGYANRRRCVQASVVGPTTSNL